MLTKAIRKILRRQSKLVLLPETKILGLETRQIYPNGSSLNPEFFISQKLNLLTKQTPVVSIGSCFAREIKDYLQQKNFNYIQTATGPNARHGSAAWDRVYNTFCLRQEFERAFDLFHPVEKFWKLSDGTVQDPYRKNVRWKNEEAAIQELEDHKNNAREAFLTANVLIVTVGLTEIWYNQKDFSTYYQVPPSEVFNNEAHAFRASTLDENIKNLEKIQELMQRNNPSCNIILTVSPVPLRATFSTHNVLISNSLSKSTLIVAAQTVAQKHKNVFYFPSYEMVLYAIKKPFHDDNRHVKKETVAQIMKIFENNFVAS